MDFLKSIDDFFYSTFRIRFTDSEEKNTAFLQFDLHVQSLGYYCEEHIVITSDNVKLVVFRIKGKKIENLENREVKKQVILLQHGFLDSSDTFMSNNEKYCLPIIFCERGFDVWIMNSRGNKYNTRFITESSDFSWDYSFLTVGILDIPAAIEYILKINKFSQKIILLGHSIGATAILAGFSELPHFYIEYVLTSILISPIAYQKNKQKNYKIYLDALQIDDIVKNYPEEQALFFPDSNYTHYYNKFTNVFPLQKELESTMNAEGINWSESPYTYRFYFSKFPSGTSRNFILHLKQLSDSGEFNNFDYGEKGNTKVYGLNIPKSFGLFDMENIPTILCVGKNDKLIANEDVDILRKNLEENKFFKNLQFENMGHFCFLLNNDLTWINFLLKNLQMQMIEILGPLSETLNSDLDQSNNRIQNKTQGASFILNKTEHGNFEYCIN